MKKNDAVINSRSHWIKRGLAGAVLVSVAAGAWWYISDSQIQTLSTDAVAAQDTDESTATAPEMQPALVTTAMAESGIDVSQVWLPGTVVSAHDARIAAEQSGRITWIAELGTMIEAGATIAKLDDRELRLQLADNQSQIDSLESQLRYQQSQLQRMQRLSQDNSIAASQLEENTVLVEQLQQQLRQAQIAYDRTALQVERTRVLAPFSGQLVNRMVQLGEHVNTSTVVARLVDVEQREIRVQVPVPIANNVNANVAKGNQPMVTVRSPGGTAQAPVKFVMAVADEASRMMEMRLAAEQADWHIGSAVQVGMQQGDHLPEVTIPRDALVLRGDRQFVYKVTEEGIAEQVDVSTGMGLGERIEVFGGINPGDEIILRGAERLQPGQTLEIMNKSNDIG